MREPTEDRPRQDALTPQVCRGKGTSDESASPPRAASEESLIQRNTLPLMVLARSVSTVITLKARAWTHRGPGLRAKPYRPSALSVSHAPLVSVQPNPVQLLPSRSCWSASELRRKNSSDGERALASLISTPSRVCEVLLDSTRARVLSRRPGIEVVGHLLPSVPSMHCLEEGRR